MPEYITIDEIMPGMILSEPVQNNFGQTMIPKDFKIEEKHLRLFKLWNVTGITIKKDGDDKKKEISPELIKKMKDKLESRMAWKSENSLENDFFCRIRFVSRK